MQVAFDHQVFLLQEYGGISRYICGLAGGLVNLHADVEAKIVAPLHYNAHLQVLSGVQVLGRRVPRIRHSLRFVYGLSELATCAYLRVLNPDIVHETYYSSDSVAPRNCPTVVTVYDMIVERFPSMFSLDNPGTALKRATVERASHVICISENTKRDLIELFDYPGEKISVVYLGYDKFSTLTSQPPGGEFDDLGSKPFLLYVGSRAEYKNFHSLLRALALSRRIQEDFVLVCFGGGVFSSNERVLIDQLNFSEGQIIHIGGGDDTLAYLYANATAFVYPTLYEGFGIPPLEAMSLGCPVLCGMTSSLPEVAGDAAQYFDPARVDSILDAIEQVVESSSTREMLITKGRIQCELFSWARCAEDTLKVYKCLI